MRQRLPPAQEDLYPAPPGNQARQRWFWAIARVLHAIQAPSRDAVRSPLKRGSPRPGDAILKDVSRRNKYPASLTFQLDSPERPLPTTPTGNVCVRLG